MFDLTGGNVGIEAASYYFFRIGTTLSIILKGDDGAQKFLRVL